MIVVTSLGVLVLASLTLAQIGRNMQIFAVAGLALVLVVVQLAILDLDRPFRGFISVSSTDIERVATDLGEDFDEEHPGVSLPCDERGVARG